LNISHVYSGNQVDRGEKERRDDQWIADKAKDPTSRFLPLRDLNVLVSGEEDGLGWVGVVDLERLGVDAKPIFLGSLDGMAHFVIDISAQEKAVSELSEGNGFRFVDARSVTEILSGPDSGIVAQARAQINWHNRHGFCSVCGHETVVLRGGQKRECPHCKAEHFPRVDPVIIMVVSDRERCLLGQSRGRLAAANRYSALAGFVDQGESIEEAVAREVMEEAGIKVKNVRYHSSQPWPFPSSLMIGCHAEAATTQIAMDAEEMTDVKWFEREEVLLALEEKSESLMLPGRIAIAHHLIRAWAEKEIG